MRTFLHFTRVEFSQFPQANAATKVACEEVWSIHRCWNGWHIQLHDGREYLIPEGKETILFKQEEA